MIVYRELASIERDLGFSARTLYAVSNNIPAHYRPVSIPKGGGGVRRLTVPDELLKAIQRSIYANILRFMRVSRYATAYRYGGSTVKNAAAHCGGEYVLKLDIQRYFQSIRYSTVKDRVFRSDVFSEPIRILLTMLCYCGDELPQGAPSSPAIANIVLSDFDDRIGAWCAARGIRYTRYCDDLTFSGSFRFEDVYPFVKRALREEGYFLNEGKTVFAARTHRQAVTGLIVNNAAPAVVREYRRSLRLELHMMQKHGVGAHLRRLGSNELPQNYLKSVMGKVEYVLHVTPQNAQMQSYKAWLAEQLKSYS